MKKMRLAHREIHDKEIVSAILRGTNVMTISMIDGDRPYAVPVNFGFYYGEDTLDFYFHSGFGGTKLELAPQNELLCVTMYLYREFPDQALPMNMHTYASVMAFGKFSVLDRAAAPKEWGRAYRALMENTGLRKVLKCKPESFTRMCLCKISCRLEDVYGKSEHPITSADEVAHRFQAEGAVPNPS